MKQETIHMEQRKKAKAGSRIKAMLALAFLLWSIQGAGQLKISGTLISNNDMPLVGANVFLQGTYDGCTSDSLGHFSFETQEGGQQVLVLSFVGYETQGVPLDLGSQDILGLQVVLKQCPSELDEVVINAGTFEASDKKKAVLLKPIDIALTAGANGDVYGAFGTLPGSHKVGEEGRLFVRGGEAYETLTYMDGMLVHTPFFSQMPDLPTRGRFSPLLFNGAVFSTGGYSAEYGQALSSVVALSTNALENESKSSISVMTVGVQGSHAKRWENTSLALSGELIHTGLSNQLFKSELEWLKDPVQAGTTLMFRHKISETGMIKSFGSFAYDASSLLYENVEQSSWQDIELANANTYVNTSYREMLGEKWVLSSGLALNYDREHVRLEGETITTVRKNAHAKLSFHLLLSPKIKVKMGGDYLHFDYGQNLEMYGDYDLGFRNNQYAAFMESELKVTPHLAFKAGLRSEYHSILEQPSLMPRLSAAVKTGESSQLSLAYGRFCQNPQEDYQKFSRELGSEKARHAILCWQYKKDTKTLRVEAYDKRYNKLVKFGEEYSFEPGNYSNTGSGYSRGIDVFWRDKKPLGKSDYWISYSWNDSKRDYRDFPVKATPHYVSAHNVSVVYKHFFPRLNTFVSGTYSFASGRPYFNPNNTVFMSDRTSAYNDLSVGLTHVLYLFNKQSVLHLIVNNVLGFENIFGYRYSHTPNPDGTFPGSPVIPGTKRMAVLLLSFQL